MEETMEKVYLTLQGEYVEPVPGVENVFASGAPGEIYCRKIREAYDRLCSRLGAAEEDSDVEAILFASMSITDILCRKMYEHGAKYGTENCERRNL